MANIQKNLRIDEELLNRMRSLKPEIKSDGQLVNEAMRFYLNNNIYGISAEQLEAIDRIITARFSYFKENEQLGLKQLSEQLRTLISKMDIVLGIDESD